MEHWFLSIVWRSQGKTFLRVCVAFPFCFKTQGEAIIWCIRLLLVFCFEYCWCWLVYHHHFELKRILLCGIIWDLSVFCICMGIFFEKSDLVFWNCLVNSLAYLWSIAWVLLNKKNGTVCECVCVWFIFFFCLITFVTHLRKEKRK